MRPSWFIIGIVLAAFGGFITYETYHVGTSIVGGAVGPYTNGGAIFGFGFLIGGLGLIGFSFTAPKSKLTVDEIRKLGLTGDNIRGTGKDVAQAASGAGFSFCPHCGTKTDFAGQQFCGSCGFSLQRPP